MATREQPNNVLNSTPLVSVLVATYQHAGYIEQCLNSILEQQVDFAFELLVGEDDSTDGTREICERMAAENPDRIRLFLRSRKNVIKVFGKATGRANMLHLMSVARGKYVAFCEGDDRWIDPLKLQRQVDAMERDPEAAGCLTNAYTEKAGVRSDFLGTFTTLPDGPVMREKDYIKGQGIPTCTFLYRRDWAKGFEQIHLRFAGGDTPLFTLLVGKGYFLVQPEFTAVHNIHPGGIYSMQGSLHQLMVGLTNLPMQDALSGYRHSDLIRIRRTRRLKRAWNEGVQMKNWALAQLAWKHLARERSIMEWSVGRTLLNGFWVYFPHTFAVVGGAWRKLRGR
jgi:glycosyltransferase involved in cell wall biosynthesis